MATSNGCGQIVWHFDVHNPVIEPGGIHGRLDAGLAGAAHVITRGDYHHLFYWAKDSEGISHICHARCPVTDPHHWQPLGAVLGPQPHTQHNSSGPSFPFVLPRPKQPWLMYVGCWGRWQKAGRLPNTTAVAISEDGGNHWRYHAEEPVVPLDRPWDENGTGSVWVVPAEGGLRMYYTAIGEYFPKPAGVQTHHGEVIPRIGIGYAESEDGIHWHKPLKGLMVEPRGHEADPYEYIVSKPCVLPEGDHWRMWVNTYGTAYRVRSLCSRDGLHWTWNDSGRDGEMAVGAPGSFDDHQRSYPCIVRHHDHYRCWYTGNGFGATGMGYAVGHLNGHGNGNGG